MKLRRISNGLGLLAATVALALAVSGPATAQDSGGKDVLRIGWAQDPKTLNPFVGVERGGLHDLGDQLGPARQLQPEGPDPGARRSPRAGRSPRTARTVTFQLIQDAKWSDGKPITSADVKWSLEVARRERRCCSPATPTNVTAIKTPDEHTVVIETKQPDARIIGGLFVYILPEHIWGKVPVKELTASYQPELPLVGSGPYIVTEFERGRILQHGARTRSGAGEAPAFDEIQFIKYGNAGRGRARAHARRDRHRPRGPAGDVRPPRRAGGHRDGERAHVLVHRARVQPLLGGELPGREVQPRRPGHDGAPGDRLRDRPRADQRDREPGTPRSSPTASCPRSTSPSTRCRSRTTRTTPSSRTRSSTRPAGC